VAGFDVILDFTTPEACLQNMRACLATGARMVIGTTGWYDKLADMRSLAERKEAGLLYGSNFAVGVQVMLQMAARMGAELGPAGYTFEIEETHHAAKLDAPSGTAISLADVIKGAANHTEVPIRSNREGDETGLHLLIATSDSDRLTLKHESFSRRGFAEGAVRAAEWLATRKGCFDFRDIFEKI
jgi:4-hydroxy-tetrahydrodipicolinate reductase